MDVVGLWYCNVRACWGLDTAHVHTFNIITQASSPVGTVCGNPRHSCSPSSELGLTMLARCNIIFHNLTTPISSYIHIMTSPISCYLLSCFSEFCTDQQKKTHWSNVLAVKVHHYATIKLSNIGQLKTHSNECLQHHVPSWRNVLTLAIFAWMILAMFDSINALWWI